MRNIVRKLQQSLVEMKKMREGKLPKKTWDEFREELKGETQNADK